jgi:predicted enzyme related to lactoylglutathione lyase
MSKQSDKVSWFEMPVDDVERASSFYGKVFGWATPPMGDDAAFALTVAADENGNPTEAGGINGGFHKREGDSDINPIIHIHVDDIDAKLETVKAAGGKVIQPQTHVGEYGLSMALFCDTEGNVMGIYNYSAAK